MGKMRCCWWPRMAGPPICVRCRCHKIMIWRRQLIALWAAIALPLMVLGGCANTSKPTFALSTPPNAAAVLVVQGLSAQDAGASVVVVRVADAPAHAPSLLGNITRKEHQLIFSPDYPFQPGLKYIAKLSRQNSPPITREFTLPLVSQTPETRITEIYPTSD